MPFSLKFLEQIALSENDKKKQVLEEKIENINNDFWSSIEKLNDRSEHRFNSRDLWGPGFNDNNLNDNEIKIVLDDNQGDNNIRIELAFDNKDHSDQDEELIEDQSNNENTILGYADDYYGTNDNTFTNVNNDADNAANKIHNWWRKKNANFWDRKNKKKIKIEFNQNICNNNLNRNSNIQSYSNTPILKNNTPNTKS